RDRRAAAPVRLEPRRARSRVVLLGGDPADRLRALPALLRAGAPGGLGQVIRSVEVILDGQHESGAYVACPAFPPYRYSWLRDGCFIADAMRMTGERESARRFHEWVAQIVRRSPEGPWDARYGLDGAPDREAWPRRQWDGLGLWLAT